MATLLGLKENIEERFGSTIKMVFSGATEAHLLAAEIGVFLFHEGNVDVDACFSR